MKKMKVIYGRYYCRLNKDFNRSKFEKACYVFLKPKEEIKGKCWGTRWDTNQRWIPEEQQFSNEASRLLKHGLRSLWYVIFLRSQDTKFAVVGAKLTLIEGKHIACMHVGFCGFICMTNCQSEFTIVHSSLNIYENNETLYHDELFITWKKYKSDI